MNVGTKMTPNSKFNSIVPEFSSKKNRIPMPGKEISNQTGDIDRNN